MARFRSAIPLTFVIGIGLLYLATSIFLPSSFESQSVVVEIREGTGLREVAKILKEEELLKKEQPFILAAKFLGAERQIQAGEYQLRTDMSPMMILDELKKGNVLRHGVTIPEGYNTEQIARLLEYRGLVSYGDFMRESVNLPLIQSLGIEGESLEGYLFPETYYFSRGEGPRKIIRTMVSTFDRVYSEKMENRARELSLSKQEVVTLASIIEKETAIETERPLISAVFHNRLSRRIPLQSDPTVIYALPDFDGNLTRKDLLFHSPYNTYHVAGLPPGPIANPGEASLMAVLYPAPVDYLYFVSKNDGTHQFSETLSEHNAAVEHYQKNISHRRRNGS